MGIVYLALLQGPGGFNKLVVVKELKPELVEDPAFLRMFLDEARLAARLNHQNIVQTNEVGNDDDRYFMAMDYLDGRAFDRVRRRSYHSGSILALPLQLRVLADSLAGLDYAHRLTDFDGTPLHLVHRDVSPSNLFITFDGQVKLLDFGIAKTRDSSFETRVGVLKGKLSYMAPEQARGERVDASADTFAVGVMLWEALTSRRLRNTQNDYELLRSLTMEELPRASAVNPAVNPILDQICAKALSVRREDRYATAAEFRAELERAIEQTGLVASHRELGATVAAMFADERAATNALIEAHVARARTAGDRIQVPIIHAGASSALGMTPSGESQWPAWDAGSSPVQQPTVRSQLPALPPVVTQVRPRSSFVIPAVTITVLALATLIYVVFFLPQRLPVAPAPVAALPQSAPIAAVAPVEQTVDPAAPAPVTPTPSVVEDLIEVEIRVTPPEASVTIDGALVSGNPFRGKFPRGEAMREVRAEAPGFVPKSRALAFSSDIKMDLALERRVRAAVAPSRPSRVSTPAPRPVEPPKPVETPVHVPEINPAGGTKPTRPIDSSNPYGN